MGEVPWTAAAPFSGQRRISLCLPAPDKLRRESRFAHFQKLGAVGELPRTPTTRVFFQAGGPPEALAILYVPAVVFPSRDNPSMRYL
jgi:hypothetical protein